MASEDPFGLGPNWDSIFGPENIGPETPKGPSGYGTQFGKEEKAPPWEAKVIDGKYYIPLSQVADLLEMNSALPKVSKGIRVRVQAQRERVQMQKEANEQPPKAQGN